MNNMVSKERLDAWADRLASFVPGATVRPNMTGYIAGHWAHNLRGTIKQVTSTEALVQWDYESLGAEHLPAYWTPLSELVPVSEGG